MGQHRPKISTNGRICHPWALFRAVKGQKPGFGPISGYMAHIAIFGWCNTPLRPETDVLSLWCPKMAEWDEGLKDGALM